MSLTRDQWLRMWETVKDMEDKIKFATELTLVKRQRLLNGIDKIKRDIQLVVGILE